MITKDGYVKVRVGLSHRLADANGYAYEHSLVVVSTHLLALNPGAVVYHKNGDRTDNRIENLQVLSRADHNRQHPLGHDGATGRFIDQFPVSRPPRARAR